MKKKYLGVGGLIAALVVIFILMVTGWSPTSSKHQKPIRVVTSLNFYGEVAKAVAGDHGQVTSFINSSATDPHDYQATTKQAKQVANANVVIENGLDYDGWLNKLVGADDSKKTVVNVAKDVAGEKTGANEHVWYKPSTMEKLARYLAKKYAKLDPKHKADYEANAQKYIKKLKRLDKTIAKAKRNVKAGQEVAVSEPVFDYALENLGYKIQNKHFAKAIEDENDPSPADIKSLQSAIKNKQIAFFVNNPQESTKTVKNIVKLCKQYDVPVLNVTETEPAKKSYVEWMEDQYKQLIKIQNRGE